MGEVLLFDDGRSYFSANPPEALRYLLNSALTNPEPEKTEALLLQARKKWPDEADAHIALYKFYFVSARYLEAEATAWGALKKAAQLAGFSHQYRTLTAMSADWLQRNGPERLYLFSMKALGVIRLRRGKVSAARRVLEKLLELDPTDEIGGGAFLQIARSFTEDD